MQPEYFKPIKGYEDRYEISNHGTVKSLAKVWNHRGRGFRTKGDTILKPGNSNGYKRIVLSDGIGHKKTYSVHWLVAREFCENPDNHPIVNHKNSNRGDNYYENLEWVTYQYNAIHAFKNGNRKGAKGSANPQSKYSERDIMIIRKLYADGKYNQIEISKMFNDTQSNISRILSKQRWAHI